MRYCAKRKFEKKLLLSSKVSQEVADEAYDQDS
jgi:hypothetical protein